MKTSILLSSAILFATTLIPIAAYADDSNLMCRRSGNGCESRNGKISISGLDITVKSSDRGSRNSVIGRNVEANLDTNQNVDNSNDTAYNRDAEASPGDDIATENNNDNSVDNNTDTAGIDNNNDNNNDNTTVDADNGTGNNTDPVVDNNNSNSPVQHNSNHVPGFDPFGGLYGPGT